MTKNCRTILIYSTEGFLKELLEQSHKDCKIEQYTSFAFPKIQSETTVIIDDVEILASEITAMSALCSVIIIGKDVKKPISYNKLEDLINSSKSALFKLAENIWVNKTSGMLVKLSESQVQRFSLTKKEEMILEHIAANNNSTKQNILKDVFGYKIELDTNTLESHISRLRKKLEPELSIIFSDETGYGLSKETAVS